MDSERVSEGGEDEDAVDSLSTTLPSALFTLAVGVIAVDTDSSVGADDRGEGIEEDDGVVSAGWSAVVVEAFFR